MKDPRFSPRLLANIDFDKWTECQAKVFDQIFFHVQNKNMMLHSFTGSGKTVAFLLPELQRLLDVDIERDRKKKVIVLVPTRELAVQVGRVATSLLQGVSEVRARAICSSERLDGDENLIIATPGSLLNNLDKLDKKKIETLIIDEVDRLMDFGFVSQIERIIAFCSAPSRTTKPKLVLSSATFSEEISLLSHRLLGKDFIQIKSTQSFPASLSHFFCVYAPIAFVPTLETLILEEMKHETFQQGLVLFPTTRMLMFVYAVLRARNRIPHLSALHGRMVHAKRMHVMANFSKTSQILFSTDLAARGLDLAALSTVVQVGFSGVDDPIAQFVHRAGRTARADKKGRSILLLGEGLDSNSSHFRKLRQEIEMEEILNLGPPNNDLTTPPPAFSKYERTLSVKCTESLLSYFIERRTSLGLKSDPQILSSEGRAMDVKASIVKSVIDMVRSANVMHRDPLISSSLASKLKIDDIPALRFSSFR
jgi:superfamily II DNA/RNA helicase